MPVIMMNQKKHISILLLIMVLLISVSGYSQENTSYFMHKTQQNHIYNPALTGNCLFYIGMPALSGFGIAYENRGLHMANILNDPNNMRNMLADINSVSLDINEEILSFGIKLSKFYFTFGLSNKTNFHAAIPRDYLLFAWEGNQNFVGETLDFNNFNLNFTNYFELALGGSMQLLDNLKFGAKFKLLSGILNFDVKRWEMDLYTAPGSYQLDFHSDILLNSSAPLNTTLTAEDFQSPIPFLLSNIKTIYDHNPGFGLDLGVEYSFNDKLFISASGLNIISYIYWNSSVNNLELTGDFELEGINMNYLVDGGVGGGEDIFQTLIDSTIEDANYTFTEDSYYTHLVPQYFLGAKYEFFNWLDAGLVIHDKFYNQHHYLTYTVSANASLLKVVHPSVSYTITSSGKSNIGVGLGLKFGLFQMYVVTDNIFGAKYDPVLKIPWTGTSDNLDYRFGIIFTFFCKKRNN